MSVIQSIRFCKMMRLKLAVFILIGIVSSTALPTNHLGSSALRKDFQKLVDLKEFITAIKDRLDAVGDDEQSTTAGIYLRQGTIVDKRTS